MLIMKIKTFEKNTTKITMINNKNYKSEMLVYCPTLSTTNILTHKFVRKSYITFPQILGHFGSSQYTNSLGIHDNTLFSLSTPNAVI